MNDEETKQEESVINSSEQTEEKAVETASPAANDTVNKLLSVLKNNIKWIAVAVVVLILLCLIGSCVSGGKSSFKLVNQKNYYMEADNELLVSLKGEEIEVEEGIYTVQQSADGSLTVVKDYEYTLFIAKGNELVEVAEEVYSFHISNGGDAIAYLTDVDDGIGELHLYQVSNAKDTVIDYEVYYKGITLSEDGKSVAYIGNCETDSWGNLEKYAACVSKNGKESEKVANDATPLALTNGGKHIFYVKNGNLYMDDTKLDSDISSSVHFNQDYTELIYTEDGTTYYFTAKMKEPVKVKSGSFSGIYAPDNMIQTDNRHGSYYVYYYGVESFNEQLWNIDGTAYYVYKKGQETDKLASDIGSYQMSETGNSILYKKGSKLMYVADFTKSREGEEVVSDLNSYYTNFVASKDLKTVYYYDRDEDELCYVKKGESIRIADDVDVFAYSDKYGVVYFIEDDELYYADKTAKSKKRVCAEEVSGISVVDDEVYFRIKEKNSVILCKMKSKAKYEEIMEIDN